MATRQQIKAFREEAALAGDSIAADLCDVVLSGEDSDGTGTTLGRPLTLEAATLAVDAMIASAAAQVARNALICCLVGRAALGGAS
jgi:hypothetical protein